MAKFGKAVKRGYYGKSITRCRKCHNNNKRGALYPIHVQPVHYKLQELHSMPPKRPLGKAAANKLMTWLGKRSDKWFRSACNRGDMNACKLLAVMLVDGNGGQPVDTHAAMKLFERACKVGDGVACVRGAKVLIDRKKGVTDEADIRRLLARGCQLKQGQACQYLRTHPPRAPQGRRATKSEIRALLQTRLDAMKKAGTAPKDAKLGFVTATGIGQILHGDGRPFGRVDTKVR
ncbi:MAG: sel1 repeat family protein [Myxococcales bacterium]|nr:sel1 repeat family protein [Myxococcales bacterium]